MSLKRRRLVKAWEIGMGQVVPHEPWLARLSMLQDNSFSFFGAASLRNQTLLSGLSIENRHFSQPVSSLTRATLSQLAQPRDSLSRFAFCPCSS